MRAVIVSIAVAILLVGGATSSVAQPGDRTVAVCVLTSAKRPISDLSARALRDLYLGQTTRWPDGHPVVLVVQDTKMPDEQLFLKRVVRMSEIDFSHFWISEVFQGAASTSPRVASSRSAVKQLVAGNPDAIGFARCSDPGPLDDQLHVVTIDGHPPGDERYLLSGR